MGVGFAKDSEGSMRNNRNLKNKTKDKYFKKQKYKSNKKNNLNHEPASNEELQRVREKLAQQNKKAKTRGIIAGSITILFLIYLFFFADISCHSRTIKKDENGKTYWEVH